MVFSAARPPCKAAEPSDSKELLPCCLPPLRGKRLEATLAISIALVSLEHLQAPSTECLLSHLGGLQTALKSKNDLETDQLRVTFGRLEKTLWF